MFGKKRTSRKFWVGENPWRRDTASVLGAPFELLSDYTQKYSTEVIEKPREIWENFFAIKRILAGPKRELRGGDGFQKNETRHENAANERSRASRAATGWSDPIGDQETQRSAEARFGRSARRVAGDLWFCGGGAGWNCGRG